MSDRDTHLQPAIERGACTVRRHIRPFLPALFAAAVLLPAVCAAAPAPSDEDLRLLIRACTSCHSMDGYIPSMRSRKAWELTVKRMQNYVYGEQAFTDAEGARIVDFLVAYPEGEALDLYEATQRQQEGELVEAGVVPAPQRRVPMRTIVVAPAPPGPVQDAARFAGDVAVFLAVGLVVTGLARRAIGKQFGVIHRALAVGLLVAVGFHGVVLLAEFGAPDVLWFWYGVVSAAVLAGVELSVLLRQRFGPLFFRLHMAGGVAGLLLAVAHWIWIYV
jgi:hypothetical protein